MPLQEYKENNALGSLFPRPQVGTTGPLQTMKRGVIRFAVAERHTHALTVLSRDRFILSAPRTALTRRCDVACLSNQRGRECVPRERPLLLC